jgi:hypothetical protein
MEERWIKENDGGEDFKIYCKHFYKCHNVTPIQQQIAKKKKGNCGNS